MFLRGGWWRLSEADDDASRVGVVCGGSVGHGECAGGFEGVAVEAVGVGAAAVDGDVVVALDALGCAVSFGACGDHGHVAAGNE